MLYQPGRGTSRQDFATKTLVENDITCSDYATHLLLLDMSKAFNTGNRKSHFKDMNDILEDDELRIISIPKNQPETNVKKGETIEESFETHTGIIPRDCLSAKLFMLYLILCLIKPIKRR